MKRLRSCTDLITFESELNIQDALSYLVQFCRRIHVPLTWASQVAYECFSFTTVPQTDLKHFNLDSSLGYAWLPGGSTPTGLDTSPEPESHGYIGLGLIFSGLLMAFFGVADGWVRLLFCFVCRGEMDALTADNYKQEKNLNKDPEGQIQSFHFPNSPIRKKLNRLNSQFKMFKPSI